MKTVIQRAKASYVAVKGTPVGKIDAGLVVLLGVANEDTEEDLNYLISKIPNLRIFEDAEGKINQSLIDVNGSILLISQFTLLGDTKKGRRPSFIHAAKPDVANDYYLKMCEAFKDMGIHVETGQFQTDMEVHIINDGPVTIMMDSKDR